VLRPLSALLTHWAQSVTSLKVLIDSLCEMLRSTPFHRENYSRLIISVIIQFFQRCNDRFRDLTGRDPGDVVQAGSSPTSGANSSLKTSAEWAQRPEVYELLSDLRDVPVSCLFANFDSFALLISSFYIKANDTETRRDLMRRETRLLLGLKGRYTIGSHDLVASNRKFASICHLRVSLVCWDYRSPAHFQKPLTVLFRLGSLPMSPSLSPMPRPIRRPTSCWLMESPRRTGRPAPRFR
jgi:exocyst complex component 4